LESESNHLDLLVKDNQQRQIVIEIQNSQTPDYLERLLYGVSKVIIIGVLYFNFGKGEDYVYYNANDFRGIHTGEILSFLRKGNNKKYQRCKDIYPEYYLIHVERFKDVIGSELDEWIYMLKHSAVPTNFKAKNLDIARKKLALMEMSQEERKTYERYMMAMVENEGVLEAARNEGVQKGLQKGRDEGSTNAKLEIAKKMQESGMDIETIASLTGLSQDAIKSS